MERNYKYKYVINEEKRTVVALSTFAGEVVRGVARCAPNDTWDIEAGKKLAEARCSAKIAHKRLRRAEELVKWAVDGFEYFTEQVEKYKKYETDSIEKVKTVTAQLAKLEETFG
jgi:hypothetical protein